jgi:hypothetical protein
MHRLVFASQKFFETVKSSSGGFVDDGAAKASLRSNANWHVMDVEIQDTGFFCCRGRNCWLEDKIEFDGAFCRKELFPIHK